MKTVRRWRMEAVIGTLIMLVALVSLYGYAHGRTIKSRQELDFYAGTCLYPGECSCKIVKGPDGKDKEICPQVCSLIDVGGMQRLICHW